MTKITKEGWAAARKVFDKVWDDPRSYPEDLLILPSDGVRVSTVFSRKNRELLLILEGREGINVSQLADRTGRKIEAITRDLKSLEMNGIISIKKRQCMFSIPKFNRKSIVCPLVSMDVMEFTEMWKGK